MTKAKRRTKIRNIVEITALILTLGIGAVIMYYCIEIIKVMIKVFIQAGIIR